MLCSHLYQFWEKIWWPFSILSQGQYKFSLNRMIGGSKDRDIYSCPTRQVNREMANKMEWFRGPKFWLIFKCISSPNNLGGKKISHLSEAEASLLLIDNVGDLEGHSANMWGGGKGGVSKGSSSNRAVADKFGASKTLSKFWYVKWVLPSFVVSFMVECNLTVDWLNLFSPWVKLSCKSRIFLWEYHQLIIYPSKEASFGGNG